MKKKTLELRTVEALEKIADALDKQEKRTKTLIDCGLMCMPLAFENLADDKAQIAKLVLDSLKKMQ